MDSGLVNFIGATIIAITLTLLNLCSSFPLVFLIIGGFWLTTLMFGTRIKRFLNE